MKLDEKMALWERYDCLYRRRRTLMRTYDTAFKALREVPLITVRDQRFLKRLFYPTKRLRNEIDNFAQIIFRAEQEIVEEESATLWEHDERLRYVAAAMQLYNRGCLVNVNVWLDPNLIHVKVVRRTMVLENSFGYDRAGILALNQLIAPLEDELNAVKKAARAIMAADGLPYDLAMRQAWREHFDATNDRLPDEFDPAQRVAEVRKRQKEIHVLPQPRKLPEPTGNTDNAELERAAGAQIIAMPTFLAKYSK